MIVSEIKQGIAWNDKYKLGEAKVDEQHRKLFELLSNLVESCENKTNLNKVHDALNFLVGYTVRHFEDEEELQLKWGFPEYEQHKQLHDDFKVTVGELVKQFKESGSSEELSNLLNKTVATWLIRHIQREDKKIGVFIQSGKIE